MSIARPRFSVPHVFVLLTIVIFICSIFTWIVPSGSFERQTKMVEGHERTLLVPGTYKSVDKHISIKGALLGEEVEGKASPVGFKSFLDFISLVWQK